MEEFLKTKRLGNIDISINLATTIIVPLQGHNDPVSEAPICPLYHC